MDSGHVAHMAQQPSFQSPGVCWSPATLRTGFGLTISLVVLILGFSLLPLGTGGVTLCFLLAPCLKIEAEEICGAHLIFCRPAGLHPCPGCSHQGLATRGPPGCICWDKTEQSTMLAPEQGRFGC